MRLPSFQATDMKDVNTQISSVSDSLDRSRHLLDVYEKRARSDIGREVSQMRNALLQGSERISYVSSEIVPFMKRIENRTGRGDELDLTPQLLWLRKNLASILTEIETAEAKANGAMSLTMNYQTSVSDVRQSAEAGQRKLREAHGTAVAMKSMAETRLEQSTELVEEARSDARTMRVRKDLLQQTAAEIRSELENARERVCEMNRLLSQARAEAEKVKDGALLGAAVAFGGLCLAPFTGGLTLLATGAGVGYSGGSAYSYNKINNSIAEAQTSVSTYESNLEDVDSSLNELEREESTLQSHITSLESTIWIQRAEQSRYQEQLEKANTAIASNSGVQQKADSVINNAQDLTRELQQLKQKLNSCAADIGKETTLLKVESSWTDRLVTRKTKRARRFKNEKAALQRAASALAGAQQTVPKILPEASVRFLTLSPYISKFDSRAAGRIPDIILV